MTAWRRALIAVFDGLIWLCERMDRAADWAIDGLIRWWERHLASLKSGEGRR